MTIPLHISPKILKSISSLYNDINRVFMEYIDNALDSAEALFDRNLDGYSSEISILMEVSGENFRNGSVSIFDNCCGIDNFEKVVQNIGDSDKKAQPWTNGEFGYGIYSFMAGCSKLELWSKLQGDLYSLYLPIDRNKFDTARQEDVSFPDPKKVQKVKYESGTIVKLSGFDKTAWRQIDIMQLKNEIEKHFELLLGRKNLKIILIDSSQVQHICNPFDYNKYEGEHYEDSIGRLKYTRGRKNKKECDLILKEPIKIFIKVTQGKTINKNPVFIAKGRRIAEIKEIRQFRSDHKSDLWGHPNVTGYIDASDVLEPTIARTDFRNTEKSRALFQQLIDLEPLIMDVIKEVNKRSEERHYRVLEDRLNEALANLAKLDAMNFRSDLLTGKELNLMGGGIGKGFVNGKGSKNYGENEKGAKSGKLGSGEGNGVGIGDIEGDVPGTQTGGEGPLNQEASNPFEDTGFKGGTRKKSGFNIRIVDSEPVIDEESNKLLRSQLIGNEIRIFKNHQDFIDRVDESRKKEKRITQRLITYLAGEITVHYKDKFYRRGGQPEYNIGMFMGVVDFIYQLEKMLADLANKNLSDLS